MQLPMLAAKMKTVSPMNESLCLLSNRYARTLSLVNLNQEVTLLLLCILPHHCMLFLALTRKMDHKITPLEVSSV